MIKLRALCALAGCALVGSALGQGQALYGTAERVVTGLSNPLYATAPRGDLDRLFIVEQGSAGTAQIRVLQLGSGTLSTFLSVSGLSTGGERGLLGLAFHPDYLSNGYFYVYLSVPGGANHLSRVRRYTALGDPATSNTADASSAFEVLSFSQPISNHNGGWMDFSPLDDYLYIATGDGGGAGDPGNNSNDITNNLLGKMLRIDVDGDDFPLDVARNYAIPASNPFVGVTGDDEIWAYGLRNPWRCSFDRVTGDLYMGDVGQDALEEVNLQRGTSAGGENYGWRVMEANNCFDNSQTAGNPPCFDSSFTSPIYEYQHGGGLFGGFSVTGGYAYRGTALRSCFQGTYFFSDFITNHIWTIDPPDANEGLVDVSSTVVWRNNDIPPSAGIISGVSSFAEDGAGELYIIGYNNGALYRIEPLGSLSLGDFNGDLNVSAADLAGLGDCLAGPDVSPAPEPAVCLDNCLQSFDADGDTDIDLQDFIETQRVLD